MTGYCKYCRKHGVEVSQYDRHPDNTLIWNKQGEAQGICYDCELLIPSSKAELLEAHGYLKDTMHMYIATREMLNILPDEGTFNLDGIYKEVTTESIRKFLDHEGYGVEPSDISMSKDEWASRISRLFNNMKEHVGYVVVAAGRMKQENTPKGRRQAAKSIFLRGMIDHEQHCWMSGDIRKLEREYGKWYWNV